MSDLSKNDVVYYAQTSEIHLRIFVCPALGPPAVHHVIHLSNPPLWCTLQGAVSGSVQASDRLMKELREIYRSQSYKTGN